MSGCNSAPQDRNLFLIGYMGTGKSTVASRLGERLDGRVVDMDRLLEQQQGMRIGELFAAHGEDHFRELESRLLLSLSKGKGQIISCGGGIIQREENISVMRTSGLVLLLTARPETILSRIGTDDSRPLLSGNMNGTFIREMLAQRLPRYVQAAHVTVSTDGKTADEICAELLEVLAPWQA